MRIARILLTLSLFSLLLSCSVLPPVELMDGDIIFHSSMSKQSKAVELATHSELTHMGVLFQRDGEWFVAEAIHPVKTTPLAVFILRGKGRHYTIMRLRDRAVLATPEAQQRFREEIDAQLGKSYDEAFAWNDSEMYCSELVWKAYKRALGVELGKLQSLGDFDLSHPVVRAKLQERYGGTIPLDEKVISPQAIADSPLLETIYSR